MPDAITTLKEKFPQVTDRPSGDHPAINVPVADVVAVLQCLRDEFAFNLLMDLTAIDWAEGVSPRFTVVARPRWQKRDRSSRAPDSRRRSSRERSSVSPPRRS